MTPTRSRRFSQPVAEPAEHHAQPDVSLDGARPKCVMTRRGMSTPPGLVQQCFGDVLVRALPRIRARLRRAGLPWGPDLDDAVQEVAEKMWSRFSSPGAILPRSPVA
jgi:hypothetical protein